MRREPVWYAGNNTWEIACFTQSKEDSAYNETSKILCKTHAHSDNTYISGSAIKHRN